MVSKSLASKRCVDNLCVQRNFLSYFLLLQKVAQKRARAYQLPDGFSHEPTPLSYPSGSSHDARFRLRTGLVVIAGLYFLSKPCITGYKGSQFLSIQT